MTIQTFAVTGMTCEHCVGAVSDELREIDGVSDVEVDLDPQGTSTVAVTAAEALSDEQVAAALDEAGDYRFATA